jgi:hypothetical protein
MPDLPLWQAEALSRLGKLREIYAPDPSLRGRDALFLWVALMIFVLLGLLPFLLAFARPGGVARVSLHECVPWALFLGFFLGVSGWRLRQLVRGSRVRVLVCTDGLGRFDGQCLLTCRWDEIEAIESIVEDNLLTMCHVPMVPLGSRCTITVTFGGGREMRIDGATDPGAGMERLYQRICAENRRHSGDWGPR